MADPPANAERIRGSPPAKPSKPQTRSSPRRTTRTRSSGSSSSSSSRRLSQQAAAGRGGKLPHAPRRIKRGCCANPEARKGFGAVLFALGLPTFVAGVVMTIVSATDDDQDGKYPPAFAAVGPTLLVCAFILFLSGFSLISPIIPNAMDRCFSFDDPNSFCRVRCPRLSHFIKPDPAISINRAAMNALKSEPSKPALKKRFSAPNPLTGDLDHFSGIASISKDTPNGVDGKTVQNPDSTAQVNIVSETRSKPNGQKGVRFSESDAEEIRRPRAVSTSSDSSLLSLRHCKIHPKGDNGVWWTESHADYIQEEWQDNRGMSTDL